MHCVSVLLAASATASPSKHPPPRSAEHLLATAKQRLGGRRSGRNGGAGGNGAPSSHRAVNFYQAGIEQHEPQPGRYDVIWLQWAALYLTDGAPAGAGASLLWGCSRAAAGSCCCAARYPQLTCHPFLLPCSLAPSTDDLIAFLRRSAAALRPGGVLFVKENVCERGFVVDNSDASVTRCEPCVGWLAGYSLSASPAAGRRGSAWQRHPVAP